MSANYGSVKWLEEEYQQVEDDPWGLSWRGFEQCRYEQVLEVSKEVIDRLQKPGTKIRLLDVGCSSGAFTHLLRGLAGSITGIDLSKTAIQRARDKYTGSCFKVASVFDPDLGLGAYDIIICLEIIYYVSPPEQDAFLAAVNHLLSDKGAILISSKVGSPPYFSEDSLVKLASRHFAVAGVFRHGCAPLAKCEGRLFGLWKKANKLKRLLRIFDPGEQATVLESMVASSQRQATLRKLICAVRKSHFLEWIINCAACGVTAITKMCLKWKFPARFGDHLARGLHLPPTHVMLLLVKQPGVEAVLAADQCKAENSLAT